MKGYAVERSSVDPVGGTGDILERVVTSTGDCLLTVAVVRMHERQYQAAADTSYIFQVRVGVVYRAVA